MTLTASDIKLVGACPRCNGEHPDIVGTAFKRRSHRAVGGWTIISTGWIVCPEGEPVIIQHIHITQYPGAA